MGRPLETSSSVPPPVSTGSGAQAAAALAEWKREVAGKFEQFRHKRTRQRGLFEEAAEDDKSEVVPRPERGQKVVSFEDLAPERIEPLIIEPPVTRSVPQGRPGLPKQERRSAAPTASELSGGLASIEAAEAPDPDAVLREILCPYPVAPLLLRGLAGALDVAVSIVAVGLFWGIFHLMGGSFHFNQNAAGAILLASGSIAVFYFFLYTFYGAETPGLQWLGLRVLDYDGNPPQPGQRLVRSVGIVLSAAAVGLGYLWAFVDEEGLTWHDRMSKTFITRDPVASQPLRAGRAYQ